MLPTDDPTIRYVHLANQHRIGEKRNIGCRMANGDVIAHWDDDDWSHPQRLDDQVQRLYSTGKAVTGYRSMRFTDNHGNWWQYSGSPLYAVGTSLVYRKSWWEANQFPNEQIGEDNTFCSRARGAHQLVVAEANDMMYATIHQKNTSPRQLKTKNWRKL